MELRGAGHALPTDQLIAGLAHDKKAAVGAPEFVPRAARATSPSACRRARAPRDPLRLSGPRGAPLDIGQDGELFPREELLNAVAGADWRDLPMRLVAWLAVAAGATLASPDSPSSSIY